jgi:type I restriction enzyme S subunit
MSKQTTINPFYNFEIPSDWNLLRVDEFAPLQRGFDLPVEKICEGEYPVAFSNGILKYHNEFKAKAPGVVTGRSGTIGRVTFVEKDYWPHNTSLWVTDFKGNEPKFVYYFYLHFDLKRFGSGSGVPTLNRNDVHVQTILVPPLPEQKAIAHILSLMDTAINKNNLLIAKKELQKKWLMQNLLTGKKRLKGFKGEWKNTSLGELFDRVTRKNTEGNTTVVTISAQRGFVRQTDFFNKNIASEITDNYFLVERGEFCYNKSYSNGYPWGATKRLKDFDKAVVTTLYICFGLKNPQKSSGDYFEQFFDANILDKGLMKIAHEGGRAHGLLNVTPSDFFSLKILVPDIEEQVAIAKLLHVADKEIKLLKAKTEKLRAQKKWLMQVLLTGKKRLKI